MNSLEREREREMEGRGGRRRGERENLPFLIRPLILPYPHDLIASSLITPKILFPNTITLGVRASLYSFWRGWERDTIKSIASIRRIFGLTSGSHMRTHLAL